MRVNLHRHWGITVAAVAALLAGLGWLQYQLRYGAGGLAMVDGLNARIAAQRELNQQLRERNAALAVDIVALKSTDAAVEERARRDLGLIKEDEIFYHIVDPDHVLDAPLPMHAPSTDAPPAGMPSTDLPTADAPR